MSSSKTKIILSHLAVCLVGVAFSWIWFKVPKENVSIDNRSSSVRQSGEFNFTNPLLECEQAQDAFSELKPFKNDLQDLIDQAQQQKQIDFASIYYRDLNNGPWVGINEREKFSPASLLKLPVMIAYLKASETNPQILEKQVTVQTTDLSENNAISISSNHLLEAGKTYSARELITQMMVFSDNVAARLLIENIDPSAMSETYSNFGVDPNDITNGDPKISVRSYASFFRILFNSSYLSRYGSEEALKIMSNAEYKDGLVAGLPPDITVSHKFGEYSTDQNQKQLHDCGIIYYPKHPYLLCVMTRGTNTKSLSSFIQNTSDLVYKEVKNQLEN